MCLLKEFVKFVVFAFNLIFLLVGAALITIGAFYIANFTDVTDHIPDPYTHIEYIPILTTVVGSVIFLISFFGCCGAIKNSPCLLTTYAVILLVIFILQVALGVFAFIEIKNDKDLRKETDKEVDTLFHKADNASVEAIDLMQQQLKCCGTTGPSFWTNQGKDVPKSCRVEDNSTKTYQQGCQEAFYTFLKDAARIIGIVVLALAATEVIGATFALCLANSVRNDLRRSEYY